MASDLNKMVKEVQFNVLEGDYDRLQNDSAALVEAVAAKDGKQGILEVGELLPSVCFSPGLSKSGKFYKVVSNKKREPLPDRKEKKKRGSNHSGSIEFMNAMDPENVGASNGADALNYDHGYFDFLNIPEFHSGKFNSVHDRIKQMVQMSSETAADQANGGELASEQMAELNQ